MKTKFITKDGMEHRFTDIVIENIINNKYFLSEYSMKELDELYKKYFGYYETVYPQILEAKIKLYDSSEAVNSFLIDGKSYWLDKATRVGLMHLANCSTDDIQLVLGDKILKFPVEFAKDFLAKLEVYAGQCYLQTQKHLMAVKNLTTVEDIINYDYTNGYPEKITLE